MIISDLNYLEITSEEVIGGYDFEATKKVDIKANITEVININKTVNSVVTLVGNLATAEGQATAFGNNTLAEVFSFTNTDSNSSAANSFSTSATKK